MVLHNWEKIKLSRLCSKVGDGIHSTPKYTDKSEFFFINGNNLKNGFIRTTQETKKVSKSEFEKYYIALDKNTLLMSINGTLGSLAFYRNENIILGKSAAYFQCDSINTCFLYYYLQLTGVQEHFHNIATGSTIKNLSLGSLNNFEVPTPNKNRQTQIAKVLSDLDAKIEINNKINQQLEAMAKTLYDHWFVQFDFPDANGNPYKSSGGKMVYDEKLKREIPEGWESGEMNDLGEIKGGGTPSTKVDEYFTKNGIAWITPKDLSNTTNKYIKNGEIDITQLGLDKSSANLLPAGSVLLTTRAPIGYLAISLNEVCTNQGFKSVIPKKIYGSEFVYFTIQLYIPHLKNIGVGSTFKEISKDVFSKVKVVVPNSELLESFKEMTKSISKRAIIAEQETKQLTKLRDWLLPMLMNGQVTVKQAQEEMQLLKVAEPKAGYNM